MAAAVASTRGPPACSATGSHRGWQPACGASLTRKLGGIGAAPGGAADPTNHRPRQQRRCVTTASAAEDDGPPAVLGDWRAFRAKLVADEGADKGWAARQAQQNMQLLEVQNPALAREETWAHATAVAEVGGLLLATPDAPKLVGETYWQAVVFLMRHDEDGSLGIILNRPTSLNMGRGRRGLPLRIQGMESLRDAFADSRIYCGGSRAQQVITMLHGQRRLAGAVEIVPGIYTGGQETAVAEVATGGLSQHEFRFFAGCCTWKPGQLEAEIASGAWQPAACSRTLVLKQCLQLPVPLWREAMCLLGGQHAETARRQRRLDEGSDSDED